MLKESSRFPMRYKGMPCVPSDLGPVQSGSGPGPMGPRVWFLPYAMFTINLQGHNKHDNIAKHCSLILRRTLLILIAFQDLRPPPSYFSTKASIKPPIICS